MEDAWMGPWIVSFIDKALQGNDVVLLVTMVHECLDQRVQHFDTIRFTTTSLVFEQHMGSPLVINTLLQVSIQCLWDPPVCSFVDG